MLRAQTCVSDVVKGVQLCRANAPNGPVQSWADGKSDHKHPTAVLGSAQNIGRVKTRERERERERACERERDRERDKSQGQRY